MTKTVIKRLFVLLTILCMMAAYVPSFSFAASESSAGSEVNMQTEEAAPSSEGVQGSESAKTEEEQKNTTENKEEAAGAAKEEAAGNNTSSDVKQNTSKEQEKAAESDSKYLPYVKGEYTEDPITVLERQKTATSEGDFLLRASGSLTPGGTVTYKSKEIDEASIFTAGGLTGFCADCGKPRGNNHTATVEVIPNDSNAAKVLYYYCVKKGWWDKAIGEDKGKRQDSLNGMYRALFIERMVQYAYQGKDLVDFMKKYYQDESINLVKEKAKAAYDTTVPSNFKAYLLKDSDTSVQSSILMWEVGSDTGCVTLQKSAAATTNNFVSIAPVNYSLAGAVYYVYTDSACTARAKDINGNDITLTTTASGATNTVEVEPATYYAKEVTASKGFTVDENVLPVTVTAANTTSNPAKFTSTETQTYAFPQMRAVKISESGEAGWVRMLGAEYKVSYYAVDPNTAVSNLPASPTRSWTYKTVEKISNEGRTEAGFDLATDDPVSGDALYMEGNNRILPIGVFTITETKAPAGFSKDKEIHVGKIYQPSSGADAKVTFEGSENLEIQKTDKLLEEKDQNAVVRVNKYDKETGEAMAQGTARERTKGSLAGAEYDVFYDSEYATEPVKVGTIVTDEEGFGELSVNEETGKELKLGHYIVKESKASPGYTLDETSYSLIARTQMIESDYVYVVAESREQPHHTYVSKRDIVTGEELPGATLQVLNSAGEIIEEWVSTDEPHDIIAFHDETQGLKDGKYTLREITAPYGYDTAEDVEFEVKSGEVENTVEMKNAPITIETTATDEETESHSGTFSSEEKIKDVVEFENLYAGREYTFKGTLMDKATGEALKDASGEEITAETTYTPEGEAGTLVSGKVELEFTVDASEFTKEKTVVAFEKVYRENRELAMHADLEDEPQTIHYVGIAATTAVDKASKSHNLLAGKSAVIVDTVKYENLVVDETYKIKGEIYDKTTGKLTGIKAEKTFTAKTTDGSVDVELEFDASGMENHVLVVFETLLVNDIEIDRHEEPDDEDQTVYVPEIGTKATDVKTEDHIAYGGESVTVKDVVEYKNLIPGKEYEMTGTLMNKSTGKPVVSKGAAVTESKTFTPQTADGSVEIYFTFDGVDLRGETVVAFEECKVGKIPVAVHADINDKDQSVNIPEIGTKASLSKADKEVNDLVSYKNLKPGKYVMRGWLVDKKTGKKVQDSEGETEFEVPENGPFSGTVTVDLPIENYGKLGGHKLVAYEELYYIVPGDAPREEIVCDHKDKKDKDQTVVIPGGKPKTGEDNALLFVSVLFLAAALGSVLMIRRRIINSR